MNEEEGRAILSQVDVKILQALQVLGKDLAVNVGTSQSHANQNDDGSNFKSHTIIFTDLSTMIPFPSIKHIIITTYMCLKISLRSLSMMIERLLRIV